MFWPTEQLVGKPVLNGCGALLGHIVEVRGGADAPVEEIVVRQEDGVKEWFVDAVHIKHVGEAVVLKGPRDGFHIAPLPRLPALDAAVLVPG